MAIPGLKTNHSICQAIGQTNNTPVVVPGIAASDVILGIIREKPTEAASAVATASFAASANSILSASVDTGGYTLTVIWAHRH